MFFRKQPLFYSLFCLLILAPTFSWAGTVVRVNSQLGEFFIELSDDTTPITANNFLRYVNEGLYNGTFIHRLETGFVIQGGWLRFNESPPTATAIPNFGNIQNEFNISNQRGTIAMAKVPGDPNSANSQWFINLGNNNFLDTVEGGFTVFGRVMGNGMQVVDTIAALQPFNLGTGLTTVPLINFSALPYLNRHFVNVNMSVAGKTDGPPAVFKPETGRMNIFVDAGALGLLAVEFELISEVPEIKVKIDPAKMFPIDRRVDTMPVFDNATGRLTIPELRVNGEVAYRNVRFMLTDGEQLVFTLEGTD